MMSVVRGVCNCLGIDQTAEKQNADSQSHCKQWQQTTSHNVRY